MFRFQTLNYAKLAPFFSAHFIHASPISPPKLTYRSAKQLPWKLQFQQNPRRGGPLNSANTSAPLDLRQCGAIPNALIWQIRCFRMGITNVLVVLHQSVYILLHLVAWVIPLNLTRSPNFSTTKTKSLISILHHVYYTRGALHKHFRKQNPKFTHTRN